MSAGTVKDERLESLLAGLLRNGTWAASLVTGLGLVLALISGGDVLATRVITAGIGCFILLPVLRVLTMLIFYAWQRDYRFVAITVTVLAILGAGLVVGMRMKTM